MKNLLELILIAVFLAFLPKSFAQTTSNTEFDPFPQAEQDMNSAEQPSSEVEQQQQQDEQWPPVQEEDQGNSDTQSQSSEGQQ